MSQNWLNKDGLFLQYGTDKTVSETAGEFAFDGPNRIIEVVIGNLASLSTTSTAPTILSNNIFFPAPPAGQQYIEKIEMIVETAATGTSSTLNVGLIQTDRATIPSGYGTSLISGEVLASMTSAGAVLQYLGPSTSLPAGDTKGGSLIGSSPANATGPYYLTAYAGTAFTAGAVRIRIYYRGIGTISQ